MADEPVGRFSDQPVHVAVLGMIWRSNRAPGIIAAATPVEFPTEGHQKIVSLRVNDHEYTFAQGDQFGGFAILGF